MMEGYHWRVTLLNVLGISFSNCLFAFHFRCALGSPQCFSLHKLFTTSSVNPQGNCFTEMYTFIYLGWNFFYTSTKSLRGYIFTAVCLCVCLSVCLCVRCFLVNKILAERMNRFGRGFR